jgi:gliding motility-associated-like protein
MDIDDLKLWNIARTQSEIQQFMYSYLPLSSPGLLAFWDMEENTGYETQDKMGGVLAMLRDGASWGTHPLGLGETYQWSPAAGLSSTSGQTVTASPVSPTTYTVTVTNSDNCTANANVNFIPGPVGDTSVYGNGEWRVYGFDGVDWNTFKGYYTDPDLSFDSENKYDELLSPSSAMGYVGCSIANDNHSVSYKRTNIPAGTYQIDFILNDDDATLLIDGQEKFSRSNSVIPTTAWVGNLTASSKVEVKWKEMNTHSRANVTFSIVTPPLFSPGTINGSQTICAGLDPLYFNSLSVATGCFISTYQWESSLDNSLWNTIVGETDSIYDFGIINETTYFRRKAVDDCGRSGYSNVIIVTVPSPLAPTAINSSLCGPGSVNLSTSGSTGVYLWYDVATGGTSIVSGSSFSTPSISVTTNYFVAALYGTCESPRSTVVATINTIPAPPTGIDDSRCGAGSVSLSASGSPDTYRWYEDATIVTSIVSTAVFNTPLLNVTRSYFVSSVSAEGCESTSRTEVIASINTATIGGALSSDASVCSGTNGATITLTGHIGNISSWESSFDNFATAGSTIANTLATFDYENLTQTTSYRVIVQAPGCAIVNSSVVTITVNSLPPDPIATGASNCGPGSVTLSATGSPLNYRWYDATVDGNIVGSASTFDTPILSTSTNYYVVSLSAAGCESSSRVIATADINDVPIFPSGIGAKRCGDGSVVLSASGSVPVFNWYDAASGGLLLSSGSTFSTPTLTETTKYYVSGVNADNCESVSRDEVIATIITIPSSPVASDISRCGPGKVTLLATGSVSGYNWYDVPAGGSVVETSSTWLTADLVADKTYYVCSLDDVCESSRVPVNVSIMPASIPGTLTSDISQVCEGANSITLTLNGNSGGVVNWLASNDNFSSNVSTVNSTNNQEVVNNLTASVAYKVIVKNGACPADTTTAVLVTVDPITNAGKLVTQKVNDQEAVLELTGYEGAIVQWEMSKDNFNTVNIINETSPFLTVSLDSATSYRVVVKSGICSIAISNDIKVEGFKIYTSITPNNDGINDFWVIDGINSYPSNKVRIFNRWGDLVYVEEGYNNKERVWNGTANRGLILDSRPLPNGTYFYQVELSNNNIKTGYVIIKR